MSLLSLLGARLPESASLAGQSPAGRGHPFPPMLERFLHVQRCQATARTLRLPLGPRSTDLRTEVAGDLYTLLQRTRAQAGRLSTPAVFRPGGILRQSDL